MTQFKFLLILAMAIVPVSFTGCETSSETSVVETGEEQTETEDIAYDEEAEVDAEDDSQN